MTVYTPTTEEVRRQWNNAVRSDLVAARSADFNRWLASVRADAWDEGRSVGKAEACNVPVAISLASPPQTEPSQVAQAIVRVIEDAKNDAGRSVRNDDAKRTIASKALDDAATVLDGLPDTLMMVHEMPAILRKRATAIRAGIVEV